MDIDMECSSVNIGLNKKRGFHPKLDSSCNLGRSSSLSGRKHHHEVAEYGTLHVFR